MEAGVNDNELDAQFRKTLCIIKQYIPCITNRYHIYCYRIWLEKLSQVDSTQKQERNLYLQELKRQIQCGILEAPFIVAPPAGQLQNLDEFRWHCKSAVCSEEAISSLNSLNSIDTPSPQFHTPCVNLYGLEMPMKLDYNKFRAIPLSCPPQQTFTAQLPFETRKKKQNITLPTNKENTPLIQKFATKNFNKDDDSSWCDVSEISTNSSVATAYASGDSYRHDINEKKSLLLDEFTVSKMVELIKKLQKENQEIYKRILKDGGNVCEKAIQEQGDFNRRVSETGTDSLCGEVECLRKRLTELQEIKHTLEVQSTRGQDALDILELELKATQAKNSELHSTIVMLESKLKECEHVKQKEIAAAKKKVAESHQKEIQLLKELHKEEIVKVQNVYQKKIVEMQHEHSVHVEKVKNTYENDIVNLKKSYQNMLEKREQQIRHLEETVQKQCSKMEEEVKFIQEHLKNSNTTEDRCYVEKIKALENCVIKLDKLFKRSEKEYQKQICKLKKKIKLCSKANQLLLQQHKLNILVDENDDRQKKLDSLISEIENHYKGLLDSILKQTLSTKLKDEAVITELRDRLIKSQD